MIIKRNRKEKNGIWIIQISQLSYVEVVVIDFRFGVIIETCWNGMEKCCG
jgi:hypothetical protein